MNRKTLIAVAVAGAFAVPFAASADDDKAHATPSKTEQKGLGSPANGRTTDSAALFDLG